MRKPNFNKLSTDVLSQYKTEIDDLIKHRKVIDEKKTKLLKKVKSLVESEGLSLDALLTENKNSTKKASTKKATRKVSPKYRNPKDKVATWSGRGRKPLWIVAHIKKGGSLDDLAI